MQKLKVDTGAAMLELDQILKANELSIALVAAIPALIIASLSLWGLARWLRPTPPDPRSEALPCRPALPAALPLKQDEPDRVISLCKHSLQRRSQQFQPGNLAQWRRPTPPGPRSEALPSRCTLLSSHAAMRTALCGWQVMPQGY